MKAPTRFIFTKTNIIDFLFSVKESSSIFGGAPKSNDTFKLKFNKKYKTVLLNYLTQSETTVANVERRKIVFRIVNQEDLLPIVTACIETELNDLKEEQKVYYRASALKSIQKAIPLHSVLYERIQEILNPPEPDIDPYSEEFKEEVKDIVARYKERQKEKLNLPKKGLLE